MIKKVTLSICAAILAASCVSKKVFVDLCSKYNIKYKMEDIVKEIKETKILQQTTLDL